MDTLRRCDLEALGQRLIERHRHAHIEAPADERQAQLLAGLRGDLDADAAVDALARLVDDVRMLRLLDESPPLGLVS